MAKISAWQTSEVPYIGARNVAIVFGLSCIRYGCDTVLTFNGTGY